ncbi:hypothetical protein ACRALDRAFT_207910 [Sodiomyces alcalophilus JCM 7366]|uniref:uncharacterized protein n=1 Tax=Sodiomyces alcalophilus JCM 7366 TaxID=591952 RepID=UPI0039B4BA84
MYLGLAHYGGRVSTLFDMALVCRFQCWTQTIVNFLLRLSHPLPPSQYGYWVRSNVVVQIQALHLKVTQQSTWNPLAVRWRYPYRKMGPGVPPPPHPTLPNPHVTLDPGLVKQGMEEDWHSSGTACWVLGLFCESARTPPIELFIFGAPSVDRPGPVEEHTYLNPSPTFALLNDRQSCRLDFLARFDSTYICIWDDTRLFLEPSLPFF